MKYLSFNFDLSFRGQGYIILVFCLALYVCYMVQFFSKINQAVQGLLQKEIFDL